MTVQKKCLEHLIMARDAEKRKRNSRTGKSVSKQRRKVTPENARDVLESSGIRSQDESDEQDGHIDEDSKLQDLAKNVGDCRTVLEQVFVTLKELQGKVEILENRVTEVQLNRLESMGPREAFIARKRSGCSNEKDSLFKECYESSVGKLRVSF